MYFINLLSVLITASLLTTASATPVVRKSLNPKFLRTRSPLSNAAFSEDWPTNVVMVGGSQTYGFWVPTDGTWYELGNIECLGLPAYAIGDCNDVTIDQIGVVAGYGPCSFVGNNGYSSTLDGDAGDGYYTVGPPQNIMAAACGPSS
ncbi:hypothetical protein AYO21_05106 [Fonsecaea monophora]|uniref:Uncharacterized protein n=2 Tax=Fonsecaea TaxID=40354 RepID=A0A0D2HHI1_9EURO|nr:uncharacterized protein Z517_03140 [Fonsecaea pedrosoi CBS 271.37]XP_022512562.1 hypothetical protein AYO21_05106 [Fonsecaea monophora]KAH0848411.1 hypothetical protein FOPE_02422 [Fonsecaea pedrosoi]KIW83894.1 hypothetical protein Z517_03140 [Fonsecaea pedrosoi CBS 271.37]OAG40610.1 hypothetical protein AYO21_05106 [Fonsecaea monophora]